MWKTLKQSTKNIFSKHKRKFVAVGTAAASAGVLYFMWGLFSIMIMLTIIMHEFGHWFVANRSGAETGYVFFIPVIFFVIGATQIKNIASETKAKVALAGPIFGTLTSLALGLIVILLSLEGLYFFALALIIFELFNLLLGSDAKKYRKAKSLCL